MSQRKRSPFDDFWSFSQPSDSEDEQKEPDNPNLPDLFEEMTKTWKSISPVIKPMIDKFKK